MIMKKKLGLIILAISLIFLSSLAMAEIDGPCEKTTGKIIKVYSPLNGDNHTFKSIDGTQTGDQCSEVPDAYRVTIYKFGLCKKNPFTANDFSSCEYYVESDAGVSHTITGGVGIKSPLPITSTPTPGKYNYIIMLLSNSFNIKHTQEYSAAVYSKPNAGDETSGTTCWSVAHTTSFGNFGTDYDNKGSPDNGGIECGLANSADPAFTTEIFDTLGEGDPSAWKAEVPGSMEVGGNAMYAKLLKANNTTAGVYSDVARMLVVIEPAAPKVLLPTSQVDIKIKLTDAVSVDTAYTNSKIYAVEMGADPVQIDVVIND